MLDPSVYGEVVAGTTRLNINQPVPTGARHEYVGRVTLVSKLRSRRANRAWWHADMYELAMRLGVQNDVKFLRKLVKWYV